MSRTLTPEDLRGFGPGDQIMVFEPHGRKYRYLIKEVMLKEDRAVIQLDVRSWANIVEPPVDPPGDGERWSRATNLFDFFTLMDLHYSEQLVAEQSESILAVANPEEENAVVLLKPVSPFYVDPDMLDCPRCFGSGWIRNTAGFIYTDCPIHTIVSRALRPAS